MLITLAIFLCPTNYGSTSTHYYSGIAYVEDIPKYDWCSFALDWLVTSIQKFQESAAKGNEISKDRTSSLGGYLVRAHTYQFTIEIFLLQVEWAFKVVKCGSSIKFLFFELYSGIFVMKLMQSHDGDKQATPIQTRRRNAPARVHGLLHVDTPIE
ncbi:unnamed protein product [Urochloa humidicola]